MNGSRTLASVPAADSLWLRRLMVGMSFVAVCAATRPALAWKVVAAPSVTFAGTSPASFAIQSLTVTLFRSADSRPPGVALPIALAFQTASGASLAPPVAATLPPDGVLAVPSSSFVPGASALGNALVVTSPGEPAAPAIVWSLSTWAWQAPKAVVMQCTSGSECPAGTAGFDAGPSATTDWMIQGNPVLVSADDSASVVGSEFHIAWTANTGDSATGIIAGDTSAITLSDGTTIAFPNGEPFASTSSALFFAPPIAFEGQLPPTFSMASNTLGTGSFSAPTLSVAVSPVPVPAVPRAPLVTLAIALAGAACAAQQRRRRA
jgi:hypothetical protein